MKSSIPLLVLLIFWLLNFLGLTSFSNTVLLIVLVPGLIKGLMKSKMKEDKMIKPFILTTIGLIMCSISSNIYEGQSFAQCFNGLSTILPLFMVYFSMKAYNIDTNILLKALHIAAICFCIFYLINYIALNKGIALVSASENAIEAAAGVDARIRLPGSLLVSYLYFENLNKYLITKKRKFIIGVILSIFVIVIMGFRTMLAGCIIGAMLLLFFIKGFSFAFIRYIFIGIFTAGLLYTVPIIQQKIDSNIERQEEGSETFANKDYARWISYNYYMEKHFHNDMEKFMGSGPLGFGSKYTSRIMDLQARGIYSVDWGLIGDAWILGITTVIGWIWFSLLMICRKWDIQHKYLSVLYIYLLLISFTTVEFSRIGNFAIHGFILYLFNSPQIGKVSQ